MSFLSKLGDFAGGFAEGLGESLPEAMEKGSDRYIDLMDQQRAWQRQDALREEDRRYQEDVSLLRTLQQNNDITGITEQYGDPSNPLHENAQAIISGLIDSQGVEHERSLRLLDVEINRINQELGDKDFLKQHQRGVTPDTYADRAESIRSIMDAIGTLEANPNMAFAPPEAIERIKDALLRGDSELNKLVDKSVDYTAYLGGRSEVEDLAKLYLEVGDPERAIELVGSSQRFFSPAEFSAYTTSGKRQLVQAAIDNGNLTRAYEFAGSNPSLLQQIDDSVAVNEGTYTESMLDRVDSMENLNIVYDKISNSTDITPYRKEQLLERADMRYNSFYAQALQMIPQHIKSEMTFAKWAEGNVDDTVMGTSPERASIGAILSKIVASPRQYQLEPWQVERFEWETSLEGWYQGQPGLTFGQQVADYYSDAVVAGAHTPEEVSSIIESVQWLSPKEKRVALDHLTTVVDPANPFGKAAMQGLGGPIRNFRIADLYGFSDLDELWVKRAVKDAALATPENRELLRKQMLAAIQKNVHDGNPEIMTEAEKRINDLFEALPEKLNLHEEVEVQPKATPRPSLPLWKSDTWKQGSGNQRQAGNKTTNQSLARDYVQGRSRQKNTQQTSTISR